MIQLILALCIPLAYLYGTEVTMHKIKERKYSTSSLIYFIDAKRKTINSQKLKKFNLFNRKKIISESVFYDQGSFQTKDVTVAFERAYFYEGNFHMQGCYTEIQDGYIESKSAIYKKNEIEYKDVMMQKDAKKYRKFYYTLVVE